MSRTTKLLIGILIGLFAAVAIAVMIRRDPGYVLVTVGSLTIETSVAFLIVFLVASFFILYLLVRYLMMLGRLPRTLKKTTARRRERRSERLLEKGLEQLNEGRWEQAETSLVKSLNHARNPTLHFIEAARAANRVGSTYRRDRYLEDARERDPRASFRVDLARADMLLETDRHDEARLALKKIAKQAPKHPRLLELEVRALRETGDWEGLRDILPMVAKKKVLSGEAYAELEHQVHRNVLADTARNGTLQDLRQCWRVVPRHLRQDETLLIDYIGYLQENDAPAEAEQLLREALRRKWSDQMVLAFGEMGRGNPTAQLAMAEGWLRSHPDNPHLLLTLGRLARRGQHPSKAQEYLEKSVRLLPTPAAYHELGEVLEETDDRERAAECYRTGLRLASGRPEVKEGLALPPAPEPEETKAQAGAGPKVSPAPAS